MSWTTLAVVEQPGSVGGGGGGGGAAVTTSAKAFGAPSVTFALGADRLTLQVAAADGAVMVIGTAVVIPAAKLAVAGLTRHPPSEPTVADTAPWLMPARVTLTVVVPLTATLVGGALKARTSLGSGGVVTTFKLNELGVPVFAGVVAASEIVQEPSAAGGVIVNVTGVVWVPVKPTWPRLLIVQPPAVADTVPLTPAAATGLLRVTVTVAEPPMTIEEGIEEKARESGVLRHSDVVVMVRLPAPSSLASEYVHVATVVPDNVRLAECAARDPAPPSNPSATANATE